MSEKPEDEEVVDLSEKDNLEQQNSMGVIKQGDYMIHVLIHEARNIQIDNADTVDPIIQVNCFKKKHYTSCKDDISVNTTVSWQEHLFFEPKNLKESDIQNEKVKI